MCENRNGSKKDFCPLKQGREMNEVCNIVVLFEQMDHKGEYFPSGISHVPSSLSTVFALKPLVSTFMYWCTVSVDYLTATFLPFCCYLTLTASRMMKIHNPWCKACVWASLCSMVQAILWESCEWLFVYCLLYWQYTVIHVWYIILYLLVLKIQVSDFLGFG